MNKIVNIFLLDGDIFQPEFHLRQPGFSYSACGPFTKHDERIQKCRRTDNLKNIYKNKLDKACFTHDATYFYSRSLAERTISGKILTDRASKIARNLKYDGYQRALASMIYIFLTKKRKQNWEQKQV